MKLATTFSSFLLLAAAVVPGTFAQLEAVAPLSRLASWSKVTVAGVASDCLAASTPGESLYTSVYYQSPDNHLREIYKSPTSANWVPGSLSTGRPVIAYPNSPLAVLHWTDASNNDAIILYYVGAGDRQLMEKRCVNGTWLDPRGLGIIVYVNPSMPGSMSAVAEEGGYVSIMASGTSTGTAGRVQLRRYLLTDPVGRSTRWMPGALDGTSTSGFLDFDGPHFFYQSSTAPYDAMEWATTNPLQDPVSAFPTRAQGVQFAAYRSRWPGTEVEPRMLVSSMDNVLSLSYSKFYCGGWCSCYAAITPAKSSPALGLSVSACTSNNRAYWVTATQQISEMSVGANGWYISNANILS